MKKLLSLKSICVRACAGFAIICVICGTAQADTLFQDTFDNIIGSGDVNLSNTVAGRQSGTVAPLAYSIAGFTEVGDSAMNPNQLTLTNHASCSPNYSFMDSDSFTIELDVIKAPSGWLGLMFGKSIQNAWPITDEGFGILLQENGGYQLWDGTNGYGHLPALPPTPYHLLVSVSMEDSSSAKIAVFANGVPIQMGAAVAVGSHNPFVFSKGVGITANYITLYNLGDESIIDNLTVRSTSSKFLEYEWTNDVSSKIDSGISYSHKTDLADNDNATVNSVTFTGSGTNNYSGAEWSMVNARFVNDFGRLTVGNPEITGGGTNLVDEFFYEAHNQSSAIILSNLTPGETYAFTLYNRGYAGDRRSYFAPSDSDSAIVLLNQNLSGNAGRLVKYIYTAPSNGVFSMAITTAPGANVWYLYAFSNEKTPPSPVANVTASEGTYSDKVVVTWDEVESANRYQVYRNTTTDSNTAVTNSPELTTNIFNDTSGSVNLDYYYWVKAGNSNGWSDFSDYAMGFSTDSTGPDTPVNYLPVDDAKVDFPVTLEGSAYSDQGPWPMVSIQWQTDDQTNFIYTTWDTGEIFTNAVSIEVPTSVLGLTNYWRVRYKNNRNAWSDWSMPTSFRTERDANSPFYFYDTFNNISGSGNVNKDYTASGRQYGRIIPVDYSFTGTTEVGGTAVNPNELTLSSSGSACSPNWSFEESTNFMVDVKIKPSAEGAAVTYGKASQNLPADSSGGFGIKFYGGASGRYDVYDGTFLVGTFTNDIIKASELHVLLTASTTSFDNDPAYVAATVNGSPLILRRQWLIDANTNYNRWGYYYAYERTGGFMDNYVTLYNYGGNSVFDDLKITTIKAKLFTREWDDDADTWIGTSNSVSDFTHAVNLNTNANITVNGLEFIGGGQATNWISPDTFHACHGSNWYLYAVNDLILWWSQAAPFSGDSSKIAERCFYTWSASDGIVLSNLVPNSINVLNLYLWPFGLDASRISYISGSDGGLFEVNANEFVPNGQIVQYEYTAGSDGTFMFTLTPLPSQDPFVYGFSSYLKDISEPEIDVVDALDFGEVAVSGSKSMNLDIFNVGGGVVSGTVSFASVDTFFTASTNYYYSTQESPDTINVFFQPDEEIDYSNTLYLTGSGTNGIIEVALTGTGIPEPCYLLFIIYYLSFIIGRMKFKSKT